MMSKFVLIVIIFFIGGLVGSIALGIVYALLIELTRRRISDKIFIILLLPLVLFSAGVGGYLANRDYKSKLAVVDKIYSKPELSRDVVVFELEESREFKVWAYSSLILGALFSTLLYFPGQFKHLIVPLPKKNINGNEFEPL